MQLLGGKTPTLRDNFLRHARVLTGREWVRGGHDHKWLCLSAGDPHSAAVDRASWWPLWAPSAGGGAMSGWGSVFSQQHRQLSVHGLVASLPYDWTCTFIAGFLRTMLVSCSTRLYMCVCCPACVCSCVCACEHACVRLWTFVSVWVYERVYAYGCFVDEVY